MQNLHIGTSGWSYVSWKGQFFPQELMIRHQLPYYATQFSTVELNGVFYRTPSLQSVLDWRRETPAQFVFAWKASKFITHWKRLSADSANSLTLLETRLSNLGSKAGPVLFQLPPSFQIDEQVLVRFIRMLSSKRKYVFEFRHESWYNRRVMDLLRDNDISLCISDHSDAPSPWEQTASFLYIRGHGPGGRYKGHYSDQTLRLWKHRIRKAMKAGCQAFVYFDNDQKSAAPRDALRLMHLFGRNKS